MSESRNGNEPEGSDDSESLVPRSSRKRRGLRVPVDDVPRQSFVGAQRPAGVSARSSAEPEGASDADPAAEGATRQRVASVELSLDAEVEVEPARPPPSPPRLYRPPPPPPAALASAPPPAIAFPPAAELASATVESEPERPLAEIALAVPDAPAEIQDDQSWAYHGDDEGGDELTSEPTRLTAPLEELDFEGARADAEHGPLPQETTKVGKKRSSAPPPEESGASLPDEPLEAPLRRPSERPPPRSGELTAAARDTAPEPTPRQPAPLRPSRPPLAVESRATPLGLFGGAASTEAPMPDEEEFHDTVLADVEEVPRARRITTALPRRSSDRASADPRRPSRLGADASTDARDAPFAEQEPKSQATPEAALEPAPPTRTERDGESVQRTLVESDEHHEREVASTQLEDLEISIAEAPTEDASVVVEEAANVVEEAAPIAVETLVGLGAPTPSSPGVRVSAVVVVQRAVAVIGSPSQPPPEPRIALTTPGGLSAPADTRFEGASAEATSEPITPEAVRVERESDPGLPLDLDADAPSLADEADLVEVPSSQAPPPKPAPPPPVAAKPPPPKPPAPPAAAPAPQFAPPPPMAFEERVQLPSRPPPKKKHQWWEELFSDDYLRTVPIPTNKAIAKQVDFIEARLGLAKGATILDVGCGLGSHAIELTRRGFLVVGLDLSLPMLSRAADEAQDHGCKINFLHADMREMNFEGAFDAVLLWGTTLGYFDDETNKGVLERIHRALKPGGLLLLEVVNRDFAVKSQPNLVWFQGDSCVVMEETSFNFIASRLSVKRNVILDDGRQRETTYSIRLYSLHELGQVLHLRGFRVVEITGREATPGVYFGADSPKLIILAERRVQAPPAPPRKSETTDTKTDAPRVEVPAKVGTGHEKDPGNGDAS